ncbi:MAG: hypothetical protein IPM54_22980 [Polyangiaceae bacterium]|nr:hypothetical protein [Polyangiaceae bacterium]
MGRWMTLVLLAASMCVVACEEQKPAQPAAGDGKTATAEAVKDDDIPTPADFDDEAEKDITPANYKAEVDALEKEISAE